MKQLPALLLLCRHTLLMPPPTTKTRNDQALHCADTPPNTHTQQKRTTAEPYTVLRVPKIFNLRTDPYER